MCLQSGTLLQGGKYRIEEVLGQGGFGITYLAVQTNLKNRKVAIKEFFLKEHCERDSSTSHVSMGTSGSRDLVYKFKAKFIKEAETISELENDHIIRINDVFEENGTAYYVMEYLSCGSLSDRIPSGGLPESEAVGYIRQVCDALSYIHGRKILHLDIKPSNILFRKADEAVLIDFGISKHYDDAGGSQTSSTPVGVSRGYAPLEQYKQSGVSQFSPATDIYSLGATLYKLLTGQTPPDADEVNEEGLLPLPSSVSSSVRMAVEKAMSPRRKDRPQSVEGFLELLDTSVVTVPEDDTKVVDSSSEELDGSSYGNSDPSDSSSVSEIKGLSRNLKWLLGLAVGLVAAVVLHFVFRNRPDYRSDDVVVQADTVAVETQSSSDLAYAASYSNGILRVKGVEYPMVYVRGGSFYMGALALVQRSDAESNEKPVHRVTLSGYSIGKYEVTQELWEAVMGSNPSDFKGARRPVENVSWDDCQDFIRKLNELTGASFRLPTEAEWEFAARGRKSRRGYLYSGSDTIGEVAWYEIHNLNETHLVGGKSPNKLGLYDMSGNVCEWCSDWYSSYSSSSQSNPSGPDSGSNRVHRGGSYSSNAINCQVCIRGAASPGDRSSRLGFRLCL